MTPPRFSRCLFTASLGLALCTAPFALSFAGAETAQEGSALIETRCASCHGAAKVTQTRKDKRQWEKTVNRMVGKGAQLTDTEKALLIAYLAEHHGK